MNWQLLLGVAGSLALGYGSVLYVLAIVSGETKPHFWTWCIFSIGSTGGAISTWQGGSGLSGEIAPVTLAVLCWCIFILSWKKKYRHEGLERKYHPWLAAAGLLTYVLQLSFHGSPLYAVSVAIVVDFSALHIQWLKSWRDPHSEGDVTPWAFGTLGGLLGVASLAEWNLTSLAFPGYFFVTNLVIVGILLWRKPRVQRTKKGRG